MGDFTLSAAIIGFLVGIWFGGTAILSVNHDEAAGGILTVKGDTFVCRPYEPKKDEAR